MSINEEISKMSIHEGPIPLLETDENGKWHVPQKSAMVLQEIENSIAPAVIVGKYRTGKSYLMNRLAAMKSGFPLGSTIQSQTKGIWMWPRPHPMDPSRCLLLLDTEGLYDMTKGDRKHDLQLFTFALLLSKCMVYNIKDAIDSNFIEELQLVTELSKNIKVKQSEEENGPDFASFFPSLFVVVRDFQHKLEMNGKKLTMDEYLETALTLKPWSAPNAAQYNMPRQCIKEFFPTRKCFTLPQPVADSEMLTELDGKTDADLTPKFLSACKVAVDDIWSKATPMMLENSTISGPGFLQLVQSYIGAVNNGGVPCIESAIEVMRKHELSRAHNKALEFYKKKMSDQFSGKLPQTDASLNNSHAQFLNESIALFNKVSTFKDINTLNELKENIAKERKDWDAKNKSTSSTVSKQKLQQCFRGILRVTQTDFAYAGGYAAFERYKNQAITNYRNEKNLGPMSEIELQSFLKTYASVEQTVKSNEARAVADEEKKRVERQRAEQQRKHQEEQRLAAQKHREEQERKDRELSEQQARAAQQLREHAERVERQRREDQERAERRHQEQMAAEKKRHEEQQAAEKKRHDELLAEQKRRHDEQMAEERKKRKGRKWYKKL